MDASALERLRHSMSGAVIVPEDPGFDAARATFNATIDRRPMVIVWPESTDDVVAAVKVARESKIPIAIRGGGHSVAGHAVGDDSLCIDLRAMRAVTVDPAARRARVQGGALWEDVDRATMPHGLATTGGTFWDTGVGGLTLSGGLGYLMGTAGLTCDNLMRATVVTAAGDVVEAGPSGDPELLWALRGGGGNFGIVTEFEFQLHPIGLWQVGRFVVHLDQAAEALEGLARFARGAPDEVVIFVLGPSVETAPLIGAEPTGPADYVAFHLVFQGTRQAAELALAPVTTLPGVHGGFETQTYEVVQVGDGTLPFGLRHYWKGHLLRDLDRASAEAVVAGIRSRPHAPSFLLLEAITGRARHEPEGGAAFGQRAARWNVSALAIWEDSAEDVAHIAWARRTADSIAPASFSGAGYANYASFDETSERVRAGFGPERFARLQAVKRRYDPDNRFRFNLNVPPGPPAS